MVTRSEEILLTLNGKDNASQMFSNVDSNAKSMAASISSAVSSINTGMMNLGAVTDNVMQGLTGKSAMDNILGVSSKAETNKVLVKNMLDDTEKNFESFYDNVDKVTDSSLISMQELMPALKAFKSATGAADKDVQSVTDEIANFGAAVLAQTGSTDLAQQSMMDLSKGIKGAFASLDQYGITQDALQRTGYWNGDENDVKGFMKAVQKVTGSTEELMETNQGLDAQIGKAFSRAGKKMGNEFLPVLKDIKRGFLDLDDSLGGNLTAGILAASGGIEVMNQGLWNVSTTVNGIRDLKDGFVALKDIIKSTGEAAETTSDAINAISNASDVIGGASNVAGAGADIAAQSSKSDKALTAGTDALFAGDMLKNNNKDYEKLKKEIEKTTQERNKILQQLNAPDTKNAMEMQNLKGSIDDKILNQWSIANDKDVQKLADLQLDKEKKYKNLQRKLSKSDIKLSKDLEKVSGMDLFKKRGKSEELSSEAVSMLFGSLDNTMEKFEKEDWGLSDVIKDSFSKQGTKISDAAEKGGESLQKGLEKMTGIPSKMKTSFNSFTESFTESISNFRTDGVKGNLKKLDQKLLDVFKGSSEIADVVDDAGDIGKTLKGTENIVEGIDDVADAGKAVSAAGPALEAGSAGAEAAAAGSAGLAASFTSMIVPLLAISAVIIIMIPIVAVIAAEAMVFVRLLADFMEALNFDSINLDGEIKGISQIATALAWVGVAMAAMTFTSIMTGLAVVTSGFMGITGPLDTAVKAIQDAASKLQQFNTVQINPSVADNIKTIADSLGAVSSAMGALTWTNITTGFSNFIAGALGFSSITYGLEQAKNDIIEASHKLQEFGSEITPLDESVASNIQNVCDSLASVGDAIGALRSIRDGQNWDTMIGDFIGGLFGEGVDIQTALSNVKQDITDASVALADFNNLSEIPEGVGDKIKAVADTLTSVKEAFDILRGFRDDNIWDDMIGGIFGETDIQSAIQQVVTDINSAASALSGISIGDNVNEDLIKKVQNLVSALTEVTNVANGLSNLPPMEGFDTSTIDTVMGNVQKAADALKGLTVGEVNEDVIAQIKNVANAMTEVSGVMTTLTTLPPMEGFDSTQITTAVTNVQTAAAELSKLSNITLGEDTMGILGTIQAALQGLKDTLAAASGFTEVSVNIGSQIVAGVQSGLSPLSGTVISQVDSAIISAGGVALSGGTSLANSVNNGFRSTLDLHTIMSTEMGYVKSAVDDGINAAKSAAESGAKEIVEAFKSGVNVGSPGDIARTMKQEMLYTKDFILGSYGYLKNSAFNAARTIVDAFGSPRFDMDSLFTNGINMDYVGALETTVSSAPYPQDNRPVTIIINEGAVQIDARNHTKKEAQALMITALDGMDNITDIRVDGA